jgi:hypothetical protein
MKIDISRHEIEMLSSYLVPWVVVHSLDRVRNTVEHTVTYSHKGDKVRLVAVTKPLSYRVETDGKNAEHTVESVIRGKKLYKDLTGTESFAGRPRRSALTNRSVLLKKNYSVTNKVHGDRHLFFVNKYGAPSFVTRQMQFIPIHVEKFHPDYAGTLVDGEIRDGVFHANDILFSKGRDTRQNTLTKRIETLYDTLMGLKMSIIRMNTYLVQEGNKVYEYPGKKLTRFGTLANASKRIFETTKSGLVFVPVHANNSTFEWTDPSFTEYTLKQGLENFFESRDALEKLLLDVHKSLEKGQVFVGHALTGADSDAFIGSKRVNFKKFTQVMKRWGFDLSKSRKEGSRVHFEFTRVR